MTGRLLGGLTVAALLAAAACKDDKAAAPPASAVDMNARCERLAKVCADKEKHVAKIVDECKQAAVVQAEKKCVDKVIAEYDCYEKTLCGTEDKVWALGDFGVLSQRRSKCVAERTASRDCLAK